MLQFVSFKVYNFELIGNKSLKTRKIYIYGKQKTVCLKQINIKQNKPQITKFEVTR